MVLSGHCLRFVGLLPHIEIRLNIMNGAKCALKYNHLSKQLKFICKDGLTKLLSWAGLELSSNHGDQSVCYKLCLEAQAAHLFPMASGIE